MQVKKSRGKLRIFLGYCAGVGKTYSMLQEAHRKAQEGVDVLLGYIEPQNRKETAELTKGLAALPTKKVLYKNKTLYEFDLDEALKRHPQLILVDELAHTNAPGSRHKKRYEDIEELLNAGIHVYTCLNIQHLESLHDLIEGITRIKVNERVPDHVLDQADDVKLIDIEAEELIERFKAGKIYSSQRAQSALEHFFARDNLIALRSIALRRCADRINMYTPLQKREYTKEHILLCISPSLTCGKVIRTAARMVQAFHADFTALYVETESESSMKENTLRQLKENITLARSLGATVISTYGDSIAYQISQFAKTSGVSQIVMGRSLQQASLLKKLTLVDHLHLMDPELEIHIIPDSQSSHRVSFHTAHKKLVPAFRWKDVISCCGVLILTTLLCEGLFLLGTSVTNLLLLFLLANCLLAIITPHPFYSIAAAFYSVGAINFFFIEPLYTFQMYSSEYPMIFFSMVIVSLIISRYARKLKKEKLLATAHARSMDILLKTSQKLQLCNTLKEVEQEACHQLYELLHRYIIFYTRQDSTIQQPMIYGKKLDAQLQKLYTSQMEVTTALWVYENNRQAGASTSTLTQANAWYLPIHHGEQVLGVAGIDLQGNDTLSQYEKNLLEAMLNEIALALLSIERNK